MMRNPDVSVRSRGVMEKCTYCVQRINEHKIDAETASVRLRANQIQSPAERTAKPLASSRVRQAQSLFGNLNDPNKQSFESKSSSRGTHSLLAELNTRPRTTYLAEISNPNPELKG